MRVKNTYMYMYIGTLAKVQGLMCEGGNTTVHINSVAQH